MRLESHYGQQQWMEAENVGAAEIPAFAPCEVTGSKILGTGGRVRLLLKVQTPSNPDCHETYINGRIPIAAGSYGEVTPAYYPTMARVTQPEPSELDLVGPKADDDLHQDETGFLVLAIPAETPAGLAVVQKACQSTGGDVSVQIWGQNRCCGGCNATGAITCAPCADGSPNSYLIRFPENVTPSSESAACCNDLAGPHIVWSTGGCTYDGEDLTNCDQFGSPLAYPKWQLVISSTAAGGVTLTADVDGTKQIEYENTRTWCCNCLNTMELTCDGQNEAEDLCLGFPCAICVAPGPTCCGGGDGIPATVTATLSELSDCPCLDAETLTLTFDENQGGWWGQLLTTCPGAPTLTLLMKCPTLEPSSGNCSDLTLDAYWSDPDCADELLIAAEPGCTCSPFEVDFKISPTDCCDSSSAASSVNVNIVP